MKKCPFCKADIEDNARFCLYCMKPLNKKEILSHPHRKTQWWVFVLVAVLVIALVSVVLLLLQRNARLPADSTGAESPSTGQTAEQAGESTDDTTQNTQTDGQSQEDAVSQEDQNSTPTPNTNQNQNSDTQKPSESTPPAADPVQPEDPTQDAVPPASEEDPTEGTTEESPQPELPKTEAVYLYRAARAGDDFNANYANAGNDIVITGISQPSADGVYDIPAYIDGKKVIAITANAFYGSNAKVVYIPATVKTIWNYAFYGCSLTDIYFRGNSIYAESKAFDRSITIHCSASCSDRNFRYYKDCAPSYGATWAEWNG